MMKKILIIGLILNLSSTTLAGTLNIGSINTEPADEIKKFLPLATYLATQLQSEGVNEGKVVVVKDIHQMAAFLKEGKVDVYVDSSFPSLAVSYLSGSKLLLRRWKKGLAEYHSVLFVRQDSGIQNLKDIMGKTIGFEEAFSTSGYYLPKIILVKGGLKLVPKKSELEPVKPNEVGYIFTGDDENTMVWVLRKKIVAGAIDNQNYVNMAKEKLGELKIIQKTFSIPRQVVSTRADLPPNFATKIKEALVKADQSEEGKKFLRAFEMTTKFDEIPPNSLTPLTESKEFIKATFGIKE
ncbi:MAG: hypothetical protein A2979_03720 [Deltaproteobacteria bacterium RIFCSPLOWO2_01_FULL_45_74]|nr:MAG: hypothetical protein A2712_05950 [Deltaproteobacteria bacterium RIFCSPHIGHO2_01_FULL_43_49]OGQ16674.1 MAG: hypothetical protein A3D22_07075 [Deltaproteobacteria bacterium RIFCSPHIGHO2_02_FULL_44_53]OGQ29812.1 MAG: hypothetical protein A3D98_09740 [Deltaproteobacteria bacterium RIFCSPHIGHO2_12_FULL_44_21]OGQ33102.1 MAG: hypothetical protein A2979_03720 [Deltaproteobacteria bacterium RIFCSPLOWO2_01_FULL_45_74]OGQ42197.1 MAG: hypothetical protein A3I70_06025 [Deltaproteobacteria bacterium 